MESCRPAPRAPLPPCVTGLPAGAQQRQHAHVETATGAVRPTDRVSMRTHAWQGPPGTGKTSLCKGLAQKLAIRMSHLYAQACRRLTLAPRMPPGSGLAASPCLRRWVAAGVWMHVVACGDGLCRVRMRICSLATSPRCASMLR